MHYFRALKVLTVGLGTCLLASSFSCKTTAGNKSDVLGDIREEDKAVRVIYKDADGKVYLVVCPEENGQVVDHIDDKKFLGKENCNANNASKTAKVPVQSLDYQTEYLPRLKASIGFSSDQPTTLKEVEELQKKLASHKDRLDGYRGLGSKEGVDTKKLDEQILAVETKIAQISAMLGPKGAAATDKIKFLDALLEFLNVNSKAAYNIAEPNAGHLLNPFIGAKEYKESEGKPDFIPVSHIKDAIPDPASSFLFKRIGKSCWYDAMDVPREALCKTSMEGCQRVLGRDWKVVTSEIFNYVASRSIVVNEGSSDEGHRSVEYFWTSDGTRQAISAFLGSNSIVYVDSKKSSDATILCYAEAKVVDPTGDVDGDRVPNNVDQCSKQPLSFLATAANHKDYLGCFVGQCKDGTDSISIPEKDRCKDSQKK